MSARPKSSPSAIEAWRKRAPDSPVILVMGMLKTKDPAPFLAVLAPYVIGSTAVAIPGEDASRPAEEVVARSQSRRHSAPAAGPVERIESRA